MNLYHEEKAYLKKIRSRVQANESLSREELTELIDRFEEMTEMTSVTVKIIDRLMKNYDNLKQEIAQYKPAKAKNKDLLN